MNEGMDLRFGFKSDPFLAQLIQTGVFQVFGRHGDSELAIRIEVQEKGFGEIRNA
jgi:hypothetical protein